MVYTCSKLIYFLYKVICVSSREKTSSSAAAAVGHHSLQQPTAILSFFTSPRVSFQSPTMRHEHTASPQMSKRKQQTTSGVPDASVRSTNPAKSTRGSHGSMSTIGGGPAASFAASMAAASTSHAAASQHHSHHRHAHSHHRDHAHHHHSSDSNLNTAAHQQVTDLQTKLTRDWAAIADAQDAGAIRLGNGE